MWRAWSGGRHDDENMKKGSWWTRPVRTKNDIVQTPICLIYFV